MQRLKDIKYFLKKNNSGHPINIVFNSETILGFVKRLKLFLKLKMGFGGTLIEKKKEQYWMGTTIGLHLPVRTSNCTYLRIHGARGYRGGYDKKELRKIKKRSSFKEDKTQLCYI